MRTTVVMTATASVPAPPLADIVATPDRLPPACTPDRLPPACAVSPESVLSVSTLEACSIEDIDADAVKVGLAQYSEAYANATDDYLKSEAEIGVEVYSALTHAIGDA